MSLSFKSFIKAGAIAVVFAVAGATSPVLAAGGDAPAAAPPPPANKADCEAGLEKRLELNADYAKKWPNITIKGTPPADGKEFECMENKFEKYFSDKPGSGS